MIIMGIRLATEEDFDQIISMCSEFWGQSGMEVEFQPEQARAMLYVSLDHGLLAVENNLNGFISAIKGPCIGNADYIMATELAWWINPNYRGKMLGVQLLKYLEKLCISQGVHRLNMLFMETSMPDRIKKLYERFGYKLQETTYYKVLSDGINNDSGITGNCGGVSSQ